MRTYSIYKFTNLVNGKVYIGKTKQEPHVRKRQHITAANNDSQYVFHCAIRKHNIASFSFEVIFNTFLEEDLGVFERHFISEYTCCILDGLKLGYNMTRGGDGNDSETAKQYANQLLSEGRHNFQVGGHSERSRAHQKTRVRNGTHPWVGESGSNLAKARNQKLKEAGLHPFCGENGSKLSKEHNAKRTSSGIHNFSRCKGQC